MHIFYPEETCASLMRKYNQELASEYQQRMVKTREMYVDVFNFAKWFDISYPHAMLKKPYSRTNRLSSFYKKRQKATEKGWYPRCGKPMKDFL